MEKLRKKYWTISLFIIAVVIFGCIGTAVAENKGIGKPKAVEIFIGPFPQTASIGDTPIGDIRKIIDDELYDDPAEFSFEEGTWFDDDVPVIPPEEEIPEGDGDSGGGALTPVYLQVCQCDSSYDCKKKATCVAQFTYSNTAGVVFEIPVREKSLPWNEFTGSGMVGQNRCQPTTFELEPAAPFWTNRFWNNIKWKLGHDQSALVKCEKSTPLCTDMSVCEQCTDCSSPSAVCDC